MSNTYTPAGAPNITYWFCDLTTLTPRMEVPGSQVSWTDQLDAAGSGQLTLNVNNVGSTYALTGYVPPDWRVWTAAGKSVCVVDVNGVIVYAWIVWSRKYDRTTGTVALAGQGLWSYLDRIIQGADYTSTWLTTLADPLIIARTVVEGGLAQTNAALQWLNIAVNGSTPSSVWVPVSWPLQQLQQVSALVEQLQQMGYGIGYDFGVDCAWEDEQGGPITATLNLDYPGRGVPQTTSNLSIDVAATGATGFTWNEDATGNANFIYETGTSTGSTVVNDSWPAAYTAGWPLLQAVVSNPATNATPSNAVLLAYLQDDLALYAYPAVTATVTIPIVDPVGGLPSLAKYNTGDGILMVIDPVAGTGLFPDPFFSSGLNEQMRIVECAATASDDAGVSTVTLTLNMPLSATPVALPEGGS